MTRTWSLTLIAISVSCAPVPSAWAAPLLITDTSTVNNFTLRPARGPLGFGQGVSVGTTYVLDHFDMMLTIGGPGRIKFMIWDAANSNLLYSDEQTVVAGPDAEWVSSETLNFTVNAGDRYFFGVIADVGTTIGGPMWLIPPFTTTQNGLTLPRAKSSNYSNYSSPVYAGDGSVTFPLRIYGDPPAPLPPPGGAAGPEAILTPEPASAVLLGLALSVAAVLWWRCGRRTASAAGNS